MSLVGAHVYILQFTSSEAGVPPLKGQRLIVNRCILLQGLRSLLLFLKSTSNDIASIVFFVISARFIIGL